MAGNAAAIRAGAAYVELSTRDDKLRAGLKAASAHLTSLGSTVAGVGARMFALGTAIKAPFTLGAKMFADAGSELADMSARTGMAVETLSMLGYAAAQTGTDLATVEGAARKMQKNLVAAATGSQEAEVSFAALGLSVERLMQMSPDRQFEAVARALAAVPNPTARAAAAMQVLGKSGTALLPMIDDMGSLTAEARRLGLVMSSEDAAAADTLGDAIDRLTALAKRAAVVVGAALAPGLIELAGTATEAVVAAIRWAQAHKPMIVLAAKIATGVIVLGGALVVLGAGMSALGTIAGGLAVGMGAIVAVFGAILSPLGLVATGLAAGAAAFFTYTQAGRSALGTLTAAFKSMYAAVSGVLGGIADAIMAGDLAMASRIFWQATEVAWAKGIVLLRTAWGGFLSWAASTFGPAINAVARLAVDAWAAIQSAAARASAAVSTTWTTAVLKMQDAWGAMSLRVVTTWNTAFGLLKGSFLFVATIAQTVGGLIGSVFSAAASHVVTAFHLMRDVFLGSVAVMQAVWGATVGIISTAWGAAVAVMGAAWGAAVGVMSAAWSAFAAVFSAVVSGISTAFGLVCSAMGVVWSATTSVLGSAWDKTVSAATAAWNAFGKVFGVVASAVASVAKVAFGAVAVVVGGLVMVLMEAARWLGKIVGYAAELIGVNKAVAAFNAAQAEVPAKNAKAREDAAKAAQERSDAAGQKINDIGAARDQRLAEIAAQRQKNADAAGSLIPMPSGSDPALDAAKAKLDAAQAALDKQLAEAKAAREQAASGGEAAGKRRAGVPSDEQIGQAVTAAKAKIDVAGSFNAAAFMGLGVGSSTQNDQLKEQKKANKELQDLNRKVERARWVVTD